MKKIEEIIELSFEKYKEILSNNYINYVCLLRLYYEIINNRLNKSYLLGFFPEDFGIFDSNNLKEFLELNGYLKDEDTINKVRKYLNKRKEEYNNCKENICHQTYIHVINDLLDITK